MAGVESIPTFLGPESAPLFGVLSVPGDHRARAGVLICPSIGKEQAETTRGIKLFAEGLAERGLAVLRFDYANTGESAGAQDAPDATQRWLDSIAIAADHLRSIGCSRLVVVGHRVGALLLAQTAVPAGADALVLWDPVTKGRPYLRAKAALYKMVEIVSDRIVSAGTEPPATDLVHTAGQSLHPDAAAAFSALTLPNDVGAGLDLDRILVALRDTDLTSKFAKALADRGVPTVPLGDQTRFLEPNHPALLTFPTTEFRRIADWIDHRIGAVPTEPITVRPRDTAVVGHTPGGRPIVTTLRTLDTETGPILLWDTAIDGSVDTAQQVFVAHSLGQYVRTGPSRLWYEVGMRVAERGGRALRYDRPAVGESGLARPGDSYLPLYTDGYRRPSIELAEAIHPPAGAVVAHAGICAGSWAAVHGSISSATQGRSAAVLVNSLMWRITPLSDYHAEDLSVADDIDGVATTGQDVYRRTRIRRKFNSFGYRSAPYLRRFTPRRWWRRLGRWPLVQLPDALFEELTERGVGIQLVFGPADYHYFVDVSNGPEGLRRTGAPIGVDPVPVGDHTCYNAVAREHITASTLHTLGL